ncbi:phosphate signaling complex PhoU family protein [Sulfurospirillum sp. 1612]|uniref:phosphate signaling complex PhoU family protein n=1 Tax=Sulfurospirillum sp. 1612 TaxID=3094835 RepID=UPI002F92DDF3
MLENYKEILDKSKKRVLDLGHDVIQAYDLLLESFRDGDEIKADEARNILKNAHDRNSKIDNEIIKTLALFSPEARDLRVVIAHLKIASELTRISDYIRACAKNTKVQIIAEFFIEDIKEDTQAYMQSAAKSLQAAVASIVADSEEELEGLYRNVNVEESKCDDILSVLEQSVIQKVYLEPEKAEAFFAFLKSMRKFERISDRSLNIVKLSYFAIKGGKIKL